MILHGKSPQGFMFEPFQGAVVQIDMSNFDVFLEQAVIIDHKPMIL